ncbi:DUF4142 domain-containing protein [Microvirga solisilvae]|uniref:DUF4142 domain-containing protein n=1 Tax=Microvirga solisilvae TaxID=2919498 RepID=UPI001FB0386F|nr:DUF4142 domain-containing protein [Microvirga solisilvae]
MKSLNHLIIALFALAVFAGMTATASAQGQGAGGAPAQTRRIEPQEFLRLAYSSAIFQAEAAKLASSRETKPDVRTYATSAADFRAGFLQRLEAFAKERSLQLPSMKEFEHRVILENLEPLDYLALSRRYSEIQVQALEQELRIYRVASEGPNPELKGFADQIIPELQRQLEGAQKMHEAVKP